MAFGDEQKVVREVLASWADTVVDWSDFNAGRFEPPAPDPAAGEQASWIRPAVRVGDARRAELGPVAIRRTTGVVIVQVFVPIGAGDAIAALFLFHRLATGSPAAALGHAASSIYGLLRRTAEAGSREILTVAAQSEFVAPSEVFAPSPC